MGRDDAKKTPRIRYLSRREMLGLMGSTAAAITLAGCGGGESEQSGSGGETTGGSTSAAAGGETTGAAAAETASTTCVVKPEQTEGPYYVDTGLQRSDIREEREGVPLDLTFNVSRIDPDTACIPLAGAIVDIWHCDALGEYSGVEDNAAGDFDTTGQTFLRGYQVTDESGTARFTMIYPGWYQGRAVHIHFNIRDTPESERGYEFTSQLYFDDIITDQVHSQGPYAEKGTRDLLNSEDGIFQGGGDELKLVLTENGQGGYEATFPIALDTAYLE